MVCPLKVLDNKLDYKIKSLSKHRRICEGLAEDIKRIEERKSLIVFEMRNGRGGLLNDYK